MKSFNWENNEFEIDSKRSLSRPVCGQYSAFGASDLFRVRLSPNLLSTAYVALDSVATLTNRSIRRFGTSVLVVFLAVSLIASCSSSKAAEDNPSYITPSPRVDSSPTDLPINEIEKLVRQYIKLSRNKDYESLEAILIKPVAERPLKMSDANAETPRLASLEYLNYVAISRKIPTLVFEGAFEAITFETIVLDKVKGKVRARMESTTDRELKMNLIFRLIRPKGEWKIEDVNFVDPDEPSMDHKPKLKSNR